MRVRQSLERVSVINSSAAIGDFDVAPAFERSKHHEQIGRAVSLILVIAALRLSRLYRDWRPGVGKQLF